MVKIENSNLEIYGIIYLIRNKVNRKYYVGQTQREKGFDDRYKHSGEGIERVYNYHKSNKEHNRSYNKHLLESIEKYGFEAFEVNKCLDYAFSLEELNIKEKVYIQLYDSFKNGYNETKGGEGKEGCCHSEEAKQKIREFRKGKHHSEEARQKMSEAKKGENSPNYGRHFSEETRKKMSEAMKGKYVGENNPNYGKHPSEETRQKISEATKGEKHPRAKAVYCYEKNEIRLTVKKWSEELCLNKVCISLCCKGKLKSTGGYHFRYATEEEIEEYKQKNKKAIDK